MITNNEFINSDINSTEDIRQIGWIANKGNMIVRIGFNSEVQANKALEWIKKNNLYVKLEYAKVEQYSNHYQFGLTWRQFNAIFNCRAEDFTISSTLPQASVNKPTRELELESLPQASANKPTLKLKLESFGGGACYLYNTENLQAFAIPRGLTEQQLSNRRKLFEENHRKENDKWIPKAMDNNEGWELYYDPKPRELRIKEIRSDITTYCKGNIREAYLLTTKSSDFINGPDHKKYKAFKGLGKHRMGYGERVTYTLGDDCNELTPPLIVSAIVGCGVNLMARNAIPSSSDDFKLYANNSTDYYQAIQKQIGNTLLLAAAKGNDVLVSPFVGAGVFLNGLTPERQEEYKTLIVRAFAESINQLVANNQENTLRELVLCIPDENNFNLAKQALRELKIPITFSITLTNSGTKSAMVKIRENFPEAKIAENIAGHDCDFGGGYYGTYTSNKLGNAEEAAFLNSNLPRLFLGQGPSCSKTFDELSRIHSIVPSEQDESVQETSKNNFTQVSVSHGTETEVPQEVSQLISQEAPPVISHEVSKVDSHEAPPVISHEAPTVISHEAPPVISHEVPPVISHEAPPVISHEAPPVISHEVPQVISHEVSPVISHEVPPVISHEAPPVISHEAPPVISHEAPPVISHEVPPVISHEVPPVISHEVPPVISHEVSQVISHEVSQVDSHEVSQVDSHEAPPVISHDVPPVISHQVSQVVFPNLAASFWARICTANDSYDAHPILVENTKKAMVAPKGTKEVIDEINRLNKATGLFSCGAKQKAKNIEEALQKAIKNKSVVDVRLDVNVKNALSQHRICGFFGKARALVNIENQLLIEYPSKTNR